MAIIHKLVDSGAEAYLPFLLAREREIRRKRSDNSDGSMSGGYAVKYELGDGIEGELRMVGNQSFVRLTINGGSRVGTKWVAFMFEPDTQYSDSNNTPTFDGPQESKRPIPPVFVMPDTGTEPIFDTSKFRYPVGSQYGPGSDEYPTIDGPQIQVGTVGEANDIRAEYISGLLKELSVEDRVGARSYPKPTKDKNGEYEYALNFGITFHKVLETKTITFPGTPPVTITNTYYRAWDTYTPANDVEVAHIKWFLDEKKPYIAAANATFAAAYAEWQAELAEWRATVLAEWEAKNVLEQVCPPYFKDLLGKQREGRSAQVAALYAEMRRGMGSLCIASRVLHPMYIPKEAPTEELAGPGTEWIEPGQSVPRHESVTTSYTLAIFPTCDGDGMRANTYVNAYPYASGGQNNPYISLSQGFGYIVNGTLYDKDRAVPGGTMRLMDQYQDWLESSRSPATGLVSFDLVYGNVPGEVYIALFEFYGYDFKTEQWMWSPSIDLLNTNPLRSCYTICFSYPDHEREAAYADRPDAMQQIAQVRSYAFLKHTKTPTGWSPAINVSAPQIVVSVSNVSLGDIPAVWCAVNGVQDWMLPASPDPNIAVDAAFMATSNPSTPGQVGSIGELKEWIHAQCLSRFNIPFN